jgi:hypothetical protein
MSNTGFETGVNPNTPGTTTASEVCAHCGQALGGNRAFEELLGKLGISDEMINSLKSSLQNVDFEQYLNTARDYLRGTGDKLKSTSDKATNFAKENPGKVAAGVAVLAVGTGLLISSLTKDRK